MIVMDRLYALVAVVEGAKGDVDYYGDGEEDGHVDGSGAVGLHFSVGGIIGKGGGRRGVVGVVVKQAVGMIYADGVEMTQECRRQAHDGSC